MPKLFKFSGSTIPNQPDDVKSFGKNTANTFRITSSFDILTATPTYAMMSGTVLLQQQTADMSKVNLILKPEDTKDIKLAVKYIIYRGLDINDFLIFGAPFDITHANTKVNINGTLKILEKMKTIQDLRASSQDVPVEALFGNDLSPLGSKSIDEFFFKNLASSSQLFSIPGGIEIGTFPVGEIGIEIILENPEYSPNVDMVKKDFYEINVTSISDPLEKKWMKDRIRHFVDPAAFYGLHVDLDGGIEYKTGGGAIVASSVLDIYNNIMKPFFTKNNVYLDVRNENGYSYNYYENYKGTSGPDMNKELMIGPTGSLVITEYYTNGWPIHIVQGIVASSTLSENEFSLQLRTAENERPLVAGAKSLLPDSESPDPDQKIQFIRETELLPILVPFPEFTADIKVKVPNKIDVGSGEQIATIVQLNYFKQIRLNDGTDAFPRDNASDHLFGPIINDMPWDDSDKIQWASTDHHAYYDGLGQGFALSNLEVDIDSIDPLLKTITLNTQLDQEISKAIRIRNVLTSLDNVGPYMVNNVVAGGGQTVITVKESIPSTKKPGDKLKFDLEVFVNIDRGTNKLIAKGIDLTSSLGYQVGSKVKLFGIYSSNKITRFTLSVVNLIGADTHMEFTPIIESLGFGAIMEVGMVLETNESILPATETVLFYSLPRYYLEDKGVQKTTYFNYKGGTNNNLSFFDTLKASNAGIEIEKYSLQISSGVYIATLSYANNRKVKENLLMLGIEKSEFNTLLLSANSQLSSFHSKMFKLIPQGNRLRDINYEPYFKFHLVVTGLDSSGVYKETTNFVEAYSRDGLIFTSKAYANTFDLGVLEISQEERFHLNPYGPSFTEREYGEYDKKMNSSDANSTYQYLYETLGVNLKVIVDSFITEINALTTSDIKTQIVEKIKSKGKSLLDTAKAEIRNSSSTLYNKDGALYIARLKMSEAIKLHSLASSFLSLSEIREYLDLLEKITRGLHSSNIPDFSTHPADIPILITGYDPFRAIYKTWITDSIVKEAGLDEDYHLSNSSGNIVLSLDGIDPTHILTGKKGIIKGSILPVRYREFNDGWIEDYFEQYINPNHPNYQAVKMIITFSYGINEGNTKYDFEMERFAARKRGNNGSVDNNLENAGVNSYLTNPDKNDKEFLETNLPTDKLFILNKVGLDQTATLKFFKNNVPFRKLDGTIHEVSFPNYNGNNDLKDSYKIHRPPITLADYSYYSDADRFESIKGSGGNYLSNEVFYRVALLREKYSALNPDLKTGHIHVGYLQGNSNLSKENMITKITESITNALENL